VHEQAPARWALLTTAGAAGVIVRFQPELLISDDFSRVKPDDNARQMEVED